MKEKQKGFTLIELLVVISIIGLLASIVLVSLNNAREKARDANRIGDLHQIQLAIEMFYDTTGSYPKEGCNPDSSNGCTHIDDSWTGAGLAADYWGHNISEFINLSTDPFNDSTHYYHYEPHCTRNGTKQGYWIRAYLENGGWYYVRGGIQDNDPDCASKCDSGPPCW